MIKENERINKSVLTANSIETSRGRSLSEKDNPLLCYYCKSPLFYIHINWGVVDETEFYEHFKVVGRAHKFQCSLREVGFSLYCAECGSFEEHYDKFFYPNNNIVCYWNDEELDIADKEEILYCLLQFNRKGDFKLSYPSKEAEYLKRKLREYEDKHSKGKKGRGTKVK